MGEGGGGKKWEEVKQEAEEEDKKDDEFVHEEMEKERGGRGGGQVRGVPRLRGREIPFQWSQEEEKKKSFYRIKDEIEDIFQLD